MTKQARDDNGVPLEGIFSPGLTQAVSYTATAGVTSDPVTDGVSVVRLMSTTDCFIAVGASPTADSSGMYIAATVETFIRVRNDGTDKISGVRVSSDGTLYVTEMN